MFNGELGLNFFCSSESPENRGPVPPRYHERVTLAPVREGEVAVLSCISQGYPPPSYWWFRDLPPAGSHVEPLLPSERMHLRDGILVVQNAQVTDSGRYICIANNTVGSERVELQLVVSSPILVHLTPQHVSTPTFTLIISMGGCKWTRRWPFSLSD